MRRRRQEKLSATGHTLPTRVNPKQGQTFSSPWPRAKSPEAPSLKLRGEGRAQPSGEISW